MLRKLFGAKKTLVGKDLAGNLFYLEGEGANCRRVVELKSGNTHEDVSVPYRMWLAKARDMPPTEQELLERVSRERVLSQRVAIIEEEEKKMIAQEKMQRGMEDAHEEEQDVDGNFQVIAKAMREKD